jgi:hypothetical protein
MKVKTIKLSTIKPNPNNPRIIKDEKFHKLVKSVETFGEKMMPLRPIIVDENKIILGGNMRFKALKELKYKEVPEDWIKSTNDMTEEEKKEFIIKDNVGFGDWDFDMLSNEWDNELLNDWGLDIPTWEIENIDYSEKNKEIDIDDFEDNMILKLNYTEEEYYKVKEALLEIAQTPEQAVWKLLNFNDNE